MAKKDILESRFQAKLIKEIHERYPDAIVIKNDGNYIQGFPDITIFHNDRYAMLETKRSKDAPKRPNQDYYVDKFNAMSFARFVYPENKEVVFNELEQALRI